MPFRYKNPLVSLQNPQHKYQLQYSFYTHSTKMFSSLTIISAVVGLLAVAPSTVSGLQYQGYANTVSCTGDFFFCNDNGGVCCSLPTGFGFSAQFNGLPAGSQGQGYTDNSCTAFAFSLFGPGTKCWNGGGARVSTLNWFHSPQRRGIDASASVECASAAGFTYIDNSGIERTIKIPGGGNNATEAEIVAGLRKSQDFAGLAKYESL